MPSARPVTPVYRPPTLAERLQRSLPYRFAHAAGILCRDEWRGRTAVPLLRRLALLRHGFLSESELLYDLSHHDRRDYVSDFARRFRCRGINALSHVFDHKLVTRSFLLAIGLPQAETLALALGRMFLACPLAPDARPVSPEELEALLVAAGGAFIMKPEDTGAGKGVVLIESGPGGLRWRRGRHEEPWYARDVGPGFYLFERRLEQGAFWRALFPESANTIRVLTMWTPGEPAPFVARAVQRIGTADTVPTDNWSGGGLSAPIDLGTGRLGAGRMHPAKGRRDARCFTHHPDTAVPLEGAMLPDWPVVVETVLRAARHFPFNPYIGWDVLVDERGAPVVLEANGNSDVNLLQIHGGLLADPRVREFYRTFGVR